MTGFIKLKAQKRLYKRQLKKKLVKRNKNVPHVKNIYKLVKLKTSGYFIG